MNSNNGEEILKGKKKKATSQNHAIWCNWHIAIYIIKCGKKKKIKKNLKVCVHIVTQVNWCTTQTSPANSLFSLLLFLFSFQEFAMVLIFFIVILSHLAVMSHGQLRVGFYGKTCPNAEAIVSNVVRQVAASNQNIAPVLLRLHFHDCFVQVCFLSIIFVLISDLSWK